MDCKSVEVRATVPHWEVCLHNPLVLKRLCHSDVQYYQNDIELEWGLLKRLDSFGFIAK